MLKCLIIDDDPMHREIAQHAIADQDLDITMEENGFGAITACRRDMPDIIILDWMMPYMDGEQFLYELEKINTEKRPYVIMCTAKGDSCAQANTLLAGKSVKMGSMDYLAKPFHTDALKEKIRNAIIMMQ